MVSPVSASSPLVVSLQSLHAAALSTSIFFSTFQLDFVFIFDLEFLIFFFKFSSSMFILVDLEFNFPDLEFSLL